MSEEILKALKTLRKRADRWWIFGVPKKRFGICFNLLMLLPSEDCVHLVAELSQGWPDHSGSNAFPIPGGSRAYFKSGNKWSGEQGAARKRLLDYMIAKLEQEVSNAN